MKADVAFWHETDGVEQPVNVRRWGKSGRRTFPA